MGKLSEEQALRLRDHFRREIAQCFRPAPRDAMGNLTSRFEHDYLVPNPPKEADLAARLDAATTADIMNFGDYSLCQFHHDAAEMALELCRNAELRDRTAGALLNFLDVQRPNGLISRAITPLKDHEPDPAKPVLAQMALRVATALEQARAGAGQQWCRDHDVYPRLRRFMRYHEQTYVGAHGLFCAHSALNSGYDNDPRLYGRPLGSVAEPGQNSFYKLEYDALRGLAELLGETDDAGKWAARSARLARLVNALLWRDPVPEGNGLGYYVALSWQHGVAGAAAAVREVIDTPAWATLLPLYAGIADARQAKIMAEVHLLNPVRYWSPQAGIRTMPLDDPLFNQARRTLGYDLQEAKVTPVSNWCGPIWILSNYYMFAGLLRYGYTEAAQDLAATSAQLLLQSLDDAGCLFECYDDRGRGLWAERFCSWNVLSITMLRESGLFPTLSV